MKHNLPNQLLDRFFISYTYEGIVGTGKSAITSTRRSPLIKASEIEDLSKKMDNVTIHNDMHRYMRDVVVGIRTHRLVKGGLTARASSELVTLVKVLAAIFQRNYATPELVLFASEKIFSHRLILRDAGDDKSTMYGTRLMTLLKAKRKVSSPSDVVADVLQAVWPPV
jgi:MoxR-like ATPase